MMLALWTVIAVWVIGIVVAYLTSGNSKQTDEFVINSMVSTVASLLQVANIVLDVLLVPVYLVLGLPWLWVLRIGVVVLLALFVHQNPVELLSALDRTWRNILSVSYTHLTLPTKRIV